MRDLPAVLGGAPASPTLIPVSSATLPPFERMADEYREVFASGMITNGKYVREFESRMAKYLEVEHVVAVSSNTTGMLLVLKCLGLRGDVIVPSFTFAVTGHVLAWNNLRPVYVDADSDTCLIDPVEVEKAITPDTCAILAVHIWGNPCAMDRLHEIAKRRGLVLLYDAAQAMGSVYRGRRVGGGGRAEVFSLSPTKLVTSGEGGVVATNDGALADNVRTGRNYGSGENYDCAFEGLNARMSELHAILGMASLEMLDENIRKRLGLIETYRKRLGKLPGVRFQKITTDGVSNGVYFSIIVDPDGFGLTRNQLAKALKAENVDSRCYYHPPLHLQSVSAHLGRRYAGQLPHTEMISRRALTLPLYSHMPEGEVHAVADAIERIHRHASQVRSALA